MEDWHLWFSYVWDKSARTFTAPPSNWTLINANLFLSLKSVLWSTQVFLKINKLLDVSFQTVLVEASVVLSRVFPMYELLNLEESCVNYHHLTSTIPGVLLLDIWPRYHFPRWKWTGVLLRDHLSLLEFLLPWHQAATGEQYCFPFHSSVFPDRDVHLSTELIIVLTHYAEQGDVGPCKIFFFWWGCER